MDIDFTNEANLALLIIRLAIGFTFMAHGFYKFYGGGRIPGTARWFDSIGMRPGKFHAVVAATTEVVVGLLFVSGFLTSFAAAGMIGLMVVAILVVHLKDGFYIISGGWEYTFILAVSAATIATIGPGEWSIDNSIQRENESLQLVSWFDGWYGLIISAGGGTIAGLMLLALFYRPNKVVDDN